MSRIEKAHVLTPEHVEIQLTPAGLGRRFVAWFVDILVEIGLYLGVWLVASMSLFLFPGVGLAVGTTAGFLVFWGYPIWFEMRHEGRTIGKKIMGIRVVDRRGLPLTFRQSFVRNIARVLDFLPPIYGLGTLSCLADRYHRRLGDLIADTLVIVEARPLREVESLRFQDEAASLRAPRTRQRIRNRIGLEEREFLLALCLRADRLKEKARYDLMEEVGDHFRRKLGIDEAHLSGERLVKGVAAVLFQREDE